VKVNADWDDFGIAITLPQNPHPFRLVLHPGPYATKSRGLSNAPTAMRFKANTACGEDDDSSSPTGLCSDFYVFW